MQCLKKYSGKLHSLTHHIFALLIQTHSCCRAKKIRVISSYMLDNILSVDTVIFIYSSCVSCVFVNNNGSVPCDEAIDSVCVFIGYWRDAGWMKKYSIFYHDKNRHVSLLNDPWTTLMSGITKKNSTIAFIFKVTHIINEFD